MATGQKSLVVLNGSAEILQRRAWKELVAQHLAEADPEYALQQVWAREAGVPGMLAAIGTVSLLAEDRVVMIHHLDELRAKEQDGLAAALQAIPPGTLVIITTGAKSDGRSSKAPLSAALMKVVKAVGEVVDCQPPRDLAAWLSTEAATLGKRLDPRTADLIVRTVGSDCDRLLGELAKLAMYLGSETDILPAAVHECLCVSEEATTFMLVDAIGVRDAPRALEVLRVLVPDHGSRGAALPVLGMIARQLRLIWQARYLLGQKQSLGKELPPEVAELLPADPNLPALLARQSWMARKFSEQARQFSEGQLARALRKVYEADLTLKGMGGELDDRTVLETLVISLCRN